MKGDFVVSEENLKVKRVQITLKSDVADELDKMAQEWGTTRSGMVTILTKLRRDYEREKYERDIEEHVVREASQRGEFSYERD